MKIRKHGSEFYVILIEFILIAIVAVGVILSKYDLQTKIVFGVAILANLAYSVWRLIRQLSKEKNNA